MMAQQSCNCEASDVWRCARQRRLDGQIACHCPCHRSQEPSIMCPKCGMVSYNPTDIRQKYCGNCHTFHEGLGRVRRPRLGDLWK
jgi:hypothetical protein